MTWNLRQTAPDLIKSNSAAGVWFSITSSPWGADLKQVKLNLVGDKKLNAPVQWRRVVSCWFWNESIKLQMLISILYESSAPNLGRPELDMGLRCGDKNPSKPIEANGFMLVMQHFL